MQVLIGLITSSTRISPTNGLVNKNTTNFSAGFYFIEITAAEFRTSAKLCLVNN